jgi:quercetin dioxygenase-like cupin family protein
MSLFDDLGSIPRKCSRAAISPAQSTVKHLTLAMIEVEPDAELPERSHENEYFGVVVEGSIGFRVGGEECDLGAGGIWGIPSNTPHSVRGGAAGAVVVDVFSPPRHDWTAAEVFGSRTPAWP